MSQSPSCKLEKVTPAIADEWLRSNTQNFRRPDNHRIDGYASEMSGGKWDANGETIKFSIDGTLLDGQHRLMAVVKSGVTIETFVARGIISTAMYVDRGKPRSVSQWLSHLKIKNAAIVASVARMVVAHDRGLWKNVVWTPGEITDADVIECAIKHHAGICGSIPGTKLRGLPPSVVTAVVFIGAGHRDASKHPIATWFVHGLFNGSELSPEDAVLHLRNRLLNNSGATRIGRFVMRAMVTRAWNKTIAGEPCGPDGIRLRTVGPGKQQAPNKIFTDRDVAVGEASP